jgi:DNA invertase Pin-like site-specific DNA recombinase
MSGESKISASHRERKVCIYVRQSTPMQVQEHEESTRRQYDLSQRALALGWQKGQIVVIDEDLGKSASEAGQVRAGYQRLLQEVVSGQVGAILSVEISRLARQDSEGHRLVEIATLMETLLIDENQVYNPQHSDDRLMLGLKVLLSSNEIRLMRQRLHENRERKAQRGELHLKLPVGLVSEGGGKIGLDPNEAVQGAVRLVFDLFRQNGRQRDVLNYFNENGLLFPRHRLHGEWEGPLEWQQLSTSRVRDILTNPLYAGAYVYGRSQHKVSVNAKGELARKLQDRPVEEWRVAHWDAFQGYISRSEYEANQRRLDAAPQRTRRSEGQALLSQMVLCGRCGRTMYTHYAGKDGNYIAYLCCAEQLHFGKAICQHIPGYWVEQCVSQRLLEALTPVQIELSLAALAELERQQTELHQQWQRQLEAARYTASLAQRRYERVEPENRLVSRQLEHRWEQQLQEVARLEADYHRFCQNQPPSLSATQRQRLLDLAQDFPSLWQAPTTTWADRKKLLQLLIADVTLTRNSQEVQVQIRWHTNLVETCMVTLPARGSPKTSPVIVERVRTLYQSHSDRQIAAVLNQEGLRTPKGGLFTKWAVAGIRRRNQLSKA